MYFGELKVARSEFWYYELGVFWLKSTENRTYTDLNNKGNSSSHIKRPEIIQA